MNTTRNSTSPSRGQKRHLEVDSEEFECSKYLKHSHTKENTLSSTQEDSTQSIFKFYMQRDLVNSKNKGNCISVRHLSSEKARTHRAKLVLWLKYVSSTLKFSKNTFFLGINIFDRYCKASTLELKDYELFGLVALYITVKYLESQVPFLKGYDGLRFSDILNTERQMFTKLDFEQTVPTVYTNLMLLCEKISIPTALFEFAENILMQSVIASSKLESNTFEAAASLFLFACKNANAELLTAVREELNATIKFKYQEPSGL